MPERISNSFGAGTPIIEVTYDDKEPWPISADGDGFLSTDPKNVSQENHGEANSGIRSLHQVLRKMLLLLLISGHQIMGDPAATKTDDDGTEL